MDQKTLDNIYGHLSAYNFLLRGLYAFLTREQENPRGFLKLLRAEMLASLNEVAESQAVSDSVFAQQKTVLTEFFDDLDQRMRNLGN